MSNWQKRLNDAIKTLRLQPALGPGDVAEILAALSANIEGSGDIGTASGKNWKEVAIEYLDELHDEMKYFQKEEEANSND